MPPVLRSSPWCLPPRLWPRLRARVTRLSAGGLFARPPFQAHDAHVRAHFRQIGEAFVAGFEAAIDQPPDLVSLVLDAVEAERRGFAYEGAAMAVTLLDIVFPWRDRLGPFVRGPADPYVYLAQVGAGWSLARARWAFTRIFRRLDPDVCWLAVDGVGFHDALFHNTTGLLDDRLTARMTGYGARAFDQGVGRCLWFRCGCDAATIAETVSRFSVARRPDLWSGVGLACAYAGGIGPDRIASMQRLAYGYTPELAQGAAFAAEARSRAGNPAAHTRDACRVLCGTSDEEAAVLVRASSIGLDGTDRALLYEIRRQRVQSAFAERLTGGGRHVVHS